MLSRIAEALYWMGRYLERADDTARLLDVHVHRMVVQVNDEHVGAALLESMGVGPDRLAALAETGPIDLWKATEVLAYDTDNPSSVAGSLRLARENARGLREVLATEVWEALNRTYHELDNHVRAARTLGPHLLFQWVRDRVALVGGLIDTVSLHDDGWRFLTVGRCLERVDMTARLLGAVPAQANASHWSGVLVSCGANDAFLRTYGGDIDVSRVLSVLLLDPDFPRSVCYALAQAELQRRGALNEAVQLYRQAAAVEPLPKRFRNVAVRAYDDLDLSIAEAVIDKDIDCLGRLASLLLDRTA